MGGWAEAGVEAAELGKKESSSITWVDPKKVVEPYPNPKKSPLGPQKVKNDPKINQNQISEMTETYKMKVIQLHE